MLCWSLEMVPHPHQPTEEARVEVVVVVVVADVWIDRWFQAREEGKSAELWMDDDRRDAETDEQERWKEINERAGARV